MLAGKEQVADRQSLGARDRRPLAGAIAGVTCLRPFERRPVEALDLPVLLPRRARVGPLDALHQPAGRLLARSGSGSEKPAGEWNSADIVCRGDVIEVTINGVPQNKVTGCSAREGKIGIQLEGIPFELRNVSLMALD